MKPADPKSQQIEPTLLRPPSVSTDLVLTASTISMESGNNRNTEERELEKERKRVRYVSAGLSAIFTFLFVVVLVSTIGLKWWYAVIICGVPALVGGLLFLRRSLKEAERRRLELEAELAAPPVIFMQYSPLLYEQIQQYDFQPCTHCQFCEHGPDSNNASQSDSRATDCTSPAMCLETNNQPPDYNVLFPKESNSTPGST